MLSTREEVASTTIRRKEEHARPVKFSEFIYIEKKFASHILLK
jgi:hypothetical protein